jgi:hypothetical protein
MPEADDIDRYFTEQVVGGPVSVPMGPTAGARQVSDHGVLVEWLGARTHLIGVAAKSLWAAEPTRALAGRPLQLSQIPPLRRRLLLGGLLLWSLLLSAGLWLLFDGMYRR